jgi:DNA-binding GntR family transcriptional regulator
MPPGKFFCEGNQMSDLKNADDLTAAANLLRKAILDGRFAPGQRLFESSVMNQFKISRGRTRQIFKILEAEGIVEINKNRGASVRKVSREEVSNLFEVLEAISLIAVRKVARRASDARIRKLLEQSLREARRFRKEAEKTAPVHAFTHENELFWGSLADLSENPVLSDIRFRLEGPLHRLAVEGLTVTSAADRDLWISNHEDLISALLDQDVGRALNHAEKSIKKVSKVILNLPDAAFA